MLLIKTWRDGQGHQLCRMEKGEKSDRDTGVAPWLNNKAYGLLRTADSASR